MKTVNRILIVLIALVLITGAGILIKDKIDHERDLRNYPVAYAEQIGKYSEEFGLDPYMVLSIVRIESSFNPNAVSNLGAVGLMQIMPETGAWIAHKLNMDDTYSEKDLYDEDTNVRFGCWYLNFVKSRFNGYEKAMICAYNAGHGTITRWLANESYGTNGELTTIPNSDVQNYYDKYCRTYAKYRELYPNLFQPGVE